MDPVVIRRRRRVADVNRKRAARACNRCKARKSKCVESDPGKCQRCSKSNLVCEFERELSIPPDDLVSLPASRDSIYHGSSAKASNRVLSPKEDPLANRDLLSPASVISQRLAEHVVAGQSKKASWPNILTRLRDAFSLDGVPSSSEKDIIAMQAHTTRQKTLHPSEMARLHAAIEAFPPRPIADFLLSVFVKHATDLFFYFDQDQILTEIDQFYKDANSILRSDMSFVCLVLATFALGSQWITLERPEESATSLNNDNDDLGRAFYTHAKALIPDIIDRSCLRSIQAPFLLGVYLMPANAIGSSYVYMGLALRKALAFDLHVNTHDQSVDVKENEIRRRLWWSIYSLERCTTVKLNRPRSVNIEIIKTPDPSPLPELDCRQRYNNIQYQVAYTRLIRILDQIAEPRDSSTELHGCIDSKKLAHDLKDWKKSLPSEFNMEAMDPSDSRYRTIFHLYLNYYYAWITIGKVALVTVARTRLRSHISPSSQTPESEESTLTDSRSCIKAARKLLLLFETLTVNRKVTRFSFTDFQGCSIATIVTLVSGITDRDSGYDARVTFGLNCLRKMATGNMTAKTGVKFVEAVQTITDEAREKLHRTCNPTQAQGPQHSISATVADYDLWAEWFTSRERSQLQDPRSLSEAMIGSEQDMSSTQPSLQPDVSGLGTIASWRTANEHFELGEAMLPMARELECPEYDFASALQSDDGTFLMGLTGLDVLDFSGLD